MTNRFLGFYRQIKILIQNTSHGKRMYTSQTIKPPEVRKPVNSWCHADLDISLPSANNGTTEQQGMQANVHCSRSSLAYLLTTCRNRSPPTLPLHPRLPPLSTTSRFISVYPCPFDRTSAFFGNHAVNISKRGNIQARNWDTFTAKFCQLRGKRMNE